LTPGDVRLRRMPRAGRPDRHPLCPGQQRRRSAGAAGQPDGSTTDRSCAKLDRRRLSLRDNVRPAAASVGLRGGRTATRPGPARPPRWLE